MDSEEYKKYFKSHYWRTSSFTTGLALAVSDSLFLLLSIGAAFFIINLLNHSWINFRSFVNYWVYIPPAIAVYYAAGLYPGILLPPAEEVRKFCLCTFFICAGIAMSITVEEADDKWPLVIAFLLAVPIATIVLPAAREFSRHALSKKRWYGVPAVIFVTGDSGDVIIDRLNNRYDFGYKPAIIIDSLCKKADMYKNVPRFPGEREIGEEIINATGIKVAIISGYKGDTDLIHHAFRYTVNIPRGENDERNSDTSVRDFGGILGYSSTHNLTKTRALTLKRAVDLTLLLVSSPLTIPLTLIVSLLIKVTSPGPIFYGHTRVGKNGRQFKCWKFRSMVIDADKQLAKILAENPEMRAQWEKDQKFENDPRVTKIGKILRKTSIDEIPQFFNILTGEMSFIGPRPVTRPELEKYGKKTDFILSVTPGLSGMWQISGRSDTGYEERINLDSYYIQNWSVWLDIWIIIKTVYVVLKGKGAY